MISCIVNTNGTIMSADENGHMWFRQHDAEYNAEPFTKNVIED